MRVILIGFAIVANDMFFGVAARAGQANMDASPATGGILRQFEAELDKSDSATEVLTRWCADHRIADPPVIVAVRTTGVDKPSDRTVRRLLGAAQDEPLRYRRVRLTCGTHVLSEADNWYRPGLLTPDMNRRLDQTDTPFGVVVRSLNFRRKTLGIQWLGHGKVGNRDLLRHRAVLVTGQGQPFSLVVETYTAEILSFGVGARPLVSR